jgi:hypothetical protein
MPNSLQDFHDLCLLVLEAPTYPLRLLRDLPQKARLKSKKRTHYNAATQKLRVCTDRPESAP